MTVRVNEYFTVVVFIEGDGPVTPCDTLGFPLRFQTEAKAREWTNHFVMRTLPPTVRVNTDVNVHRLA